MTLCIMRNATMLCTNVIMDELSLDRWGDAQKVRWKMISGTNETGITTTIQLGWKRGREWYPFEGANAAAAQRSIWMFADVCLPGDFIPTARFYVAAVGDMLVLTAAGELIEALPEL